MRVSLEEALKLTLTRGTSCLVGVEAVPVHEAAGRILREDVVFPTQLPPFDYAQMDGYALATHAETGSRFVVVGESRAGSPAEASTVDAAIAISTGAMMLSGMHVVVPWEHVERVDDVVVLKKPARAGQFIRRAGEDACKGASVATLGTRLEVTHVPALAVAERAEVHVSKRPTVALFLTGDELRAPGSEDRPGSIVDTNAPMLRSLLTRAGANVISVQHIADVEGALEPRLAASSADVLITVGGAAEGAHDHVAKAFAHLDAEWIFRGVAIKPGKPVGLARCGHTTLVALPGNPGSALVTAVLFVLPLLAALEGDNAAQPHFVRAQTKAALEGASDRIALHYGALDLVDGRAVFTPARGAASGSVAGLLTAQSLALVPIGERIEAGGDVDVLQTVPSHPSPIGFISR